MVKVPALVLMNWDAVTAFCAALMIISSAFVFITRAIIRDEIRKLNGTYLRTELAKSEFTKINERFDAVEKHFDYLRDHPPPVHCPHSISS